MNKKMKEMTVKTVVGMAVKSAKLPNQLCYVFFGKPREKVDLAVSDYEGLERFMKQKY